MSLLQLASVTLSSGRDSFFKIECDALTEEDWCCAAAMIAGIIAPFSEVVGVPRGGRRFADALWRHAVGLENPRLLIVDDVWTTGDSMERFREEQRRPDAMGAVLFARGPVADWVWPLFTLTESLWCE
jgi:orotate phosphoribosyltransferase